MSGGRSTAEGGASLAGLGGRAIALAGLCVWGLGKIGVRLLANALAGAIVDLAGFVLFLEELGARLTRALSALETTFASLRIRLASFFACLKALRASFNLAFACRASLRAASACFSACAALVARAAALCFVARRLLLESLLFILVLRICVSRIGEPKCRSQVRLW